MHQAGQVAISPNAMAAIVWIKLNIEAKAVCLSVSLHWFEFGPIYCLDAIAPRL
jgi:hypothetical protein